MAIDLCHAFEYPMLALCKYQKWKEKVKISEYRKFGDINRKFNKNIWEFYVGRALMQA